MSLTDNSKVNRSDIQAIINKINAEVVRRGGTLSSIPDLPSVGTGTVQNEVVQAMDLRRRELAAITSIARTSKVAGTAGGTPVGYVGTNYTTSLEEGDLLDENPFVNIEGDIDKLAAQCNCDVFAGDSCCNGQCCNSNSTTCCNGQCCNGNSYACCNAQSCLQAYCCNGQCVNNYTVCCNGPNCSCQANGCRTVTKCCNSNAAACVNSACCNSNASACANAAGCTNCSCNLNCSCEFN